MRDILIHLWEWHKLLLRWVKNNRDLKNVKIQFLEEGYSWKTYGDMNKVFWKRNQEVREVLFMKFKPIEELTFNEKK